MKKLFLSSYFASVAKALPEYFGDLTGQRAVFIPTAAAVESVDFFLGTSKKALTKLGVEIDELDISAADPEDIARRFGDADILFVDGGNTFFLLQELRRTGVDKLIAAHVAAGRLYIGASAGSMIAGPTIEYARHMDSPGKGPELDGDFTGLGLVDFSIVPHSTNAPFVNAAERILAAYADSLDLRPINNKQAVVVRDANTEEVSVG